MKWIVIGLTAIVGIVALMLIAGMFVPKAHTATVVANLAKSPDEVWAVIADIPRVPEWFKEVSAAERLPDRDGHAVWKETYGGDFDATVVHTIEQKPLKLVREIQPGGAFHGSWTFDLMPTADGTRLTVTEHGVVENLFFRGMMVFHDNTQTARDYVAALSERLGVNASTPST